MVLWLDNNVSASACIRRRKTTLWWESAGPDLNPRRPEYDVGVLQSRTANFGLSRGWKKRKDVSYEITRSAFMIGIDKGVIYCQARRITLIRREHLTNYTRAKFKFLPRYTVAQFKFLPPYTGAQFKFLPHYTGSQFKFLSHYTGSQFKFLPRCGSQILCRVFGKGCQFLRDV